MQFLGILGFGLVSPRPLHLWLLCPLLLRPKSPTQTPFPHTMMGPTSIRRGYPPILRYRRRWRGSLVPAMTERNADKMSVLRISLKMQRQTAETYSRDSQQRLTAKTWQQRHTAETSSRDRPQNPTAETDRRDIQQRQTAETDSRKRQQRRSVLECELGRGLGTGGHGSPAKGAEGGG